VNDDMQLTRYGSQLAKLPLDPVFGHLLLCSSSDEYRCLKEMLTAVAVLSSENLLYRPSNAGTSASLPGDHQDGASSLAGKAAAAHRRWQSHEGDLPTFLNVYRAWRHEAAYEPPRGSGRDKKAKHGSRTGLSSSLLSHREWCQRNFVSGRALVRAQSIRQQLEAICAKPLQQNGLGLDTGLSSGKDRETFLKCVAAGLFLQVATRIRTAPDDPSNGKGRSGSLGSSSSRGRYRTKLGNEIVSIHPTSSMFGRIPPPACVVYTELVTTKKTYIRGVTQIREDWLHEVAPKAYPKKADSSLNS
jgi:HrpA-like RNA helicase